MSILLASAFVAESEYLSHVHKFLLILYEQLASRFGASTNKHDIIFVHFGVVVDFLLGQPQHSFPNIREDVVLALRFLDFNMAGFHHLGKRIDILVLLYAVVLHDGPSVQQFGL